MKVAYWDCPTGIAGDMCLGALVNAGVPLEYLMRCLEKLGIEEEYDLRVESVHRQGQLATQVHVDLKEPTHAHHHARHLPEIEQFIHNAALPKRVKEWSLQIFEQLAIAEAAVHGLPPEKVHFHEVGAVDAIVDIVGTCIGLDWLNIEELYCSALPMGSGTVQAVHGRLPVPVPAVLKLWESRQVPIYNNDIQKELVTPTGAAIVVTLAKEFGSLPANFRLDKIGLGAGSHDLPIANILRLWLGNLSKINQQSSENITPFPADTCLETISVLQAQIDDLDPQVFGYLFDRLLEAGALDVFTQAIGMKKSRPGILLTVLCHLDKAVCCQQIIFRETTTLGIRHYQQQRSILTREFQEVALPEGIVRIKVATQGTGENQRVINVQPEYEDCAQIARDSGRSLRDVRQMALNLWQSQQFPS